MPETVFDLGKKVKAKHPGVYDDLPDDEVGKKVKAKFPGTYDDFTDAPQSAPAAQRVGGQKVLDYANETLSNIPSSAARFAQNLGTAVAHPVDTVGGLLKVATGTMQNMTPGYVTPERPGYSAEANAAGRALKDRYGSVDAVANTIKTDPVGVASDASAVLGGVSGLAKGASVAANAVRLPRVANAAANISRGAATASDIANPLTVPLKAAGAVSRGVARPLVKSALSLPGRTERYGATPAQAALEETSGIRPSTIRASATAKLDELNRELERLASASKNTADLTAARRVITDEIAKVKAANGIATDLAPMEDQLTTARPGFGGAVTPSGEVAAQQHPMDFLRMKRQFGSDFTKFDAAVPLKDSTRNVGNKAYHKLSSEFDRAVPEGAGINQRSQSLIPVKEGAQRADERVGAVQRAVDRSTRPTGGLAATLFGLQAAGLPGAVTAMTLQEALASPTVRMALARMFHGGGKAASTPTARRIGNTAAFAGSTAPDAPRFARGGIAGRKGPETIIVGDGGEPEAIVPLSHIRAMPQPAQRHLLQGIGIHLGAGIGTKRKTTLGEELAHARHK